MSWSAKKSCYLFFAISTLVSFVVSFWAFEARGSIGAADFIEYWAAFRVAIAGGNPYDGAQLLAMERTIHPELAYPIMMWNPPWILILLSPVLCFDLETAVVIFRGLNLALFAGSLALILNIYSGDLKFWTRNLLMSFSFYPLWDLIASGQVTLFLLFGLALFLYATELKSSSWLAASGLGFMTVKPHVLYLVFVALFLRVVNKADTRICIHFISILLVLACGTEFLLPGILHGWISAAISPGLAPALMLWKPNSLVTPLADLAIQFFGPLYSPRLVVLCVAITVVATTSLAFGLMLSRYRTMRWRQIAPIACVLSCLTLPHGWLHDHVVLILSQVAILSTSVLSGSKRMVFVSASVLLCTNLAVYCLAMSKQSNSGHAFFWFSVPYLFLLIYTRMLPLSRFWQSDARRINAAN